MDSTAGAFEGDQFETGKRVGGFVEGGVSGAKGSQNRIDGENAIRGGKGVGEVRCGFEDVFMMAAGAGSWMGAAQTVGGVAMKLGRGDEHGMVRRAFFRAGGGEDEQAGQLRRDLTQVFEVAAVFENVDDGGVVDEMRQRLGGRHAVIARAYRITNGFGALPAMSIQTLLVCRYSRMASRPLSRPMPERL